MGSPRTAYSRGLENRRRERLFDQRPSNLASRHARGLGCHWLSSVSEVDSGGRRRTWANVCGRPANGFEDRGAMVRGCPSTSAQVRLLRAAGHDRPPSSAVIRRLGSHLGCREARTARAPTCLPSPDPALSSCAIRWWEIPKTRPASRTVRCARWTRSAATAALTVTASACKTSASPRTFRARPTFFWRSRGRTGSTLISNESAGTSKKRAIASRTTASTFSRRRACVLTPFSSGTLIAHQSPTRWHRAVYVFIFIFIFSTILDLTPLQPL